MTASKPPLMKTSAQCGIATVSEVPARQAIKSGVTVWMNYSGDAVEMSGLGRARSRPDADANVCC